MNEEKNTGVLDNKNRPIELRQLDHIAGAETTIKYEEVLAGGDWKVLQPPDDIQLLENGRETMACTHFSANQHVEMYLMRLWELGRLSQEQKDFLKPYMLVAGDYRTIKTSKRFNAIMGGNTPDGNYFVTAWDSCRKQGVIPSEMLKMGGRDWAEYHNRSVITQAMIDLAKRFTELFEVKYDWVAGFDNVAGYSNIETHNLEYYLKQCPINVGVPLQARHSCTILYHNDGKTDMLEHYYPTLRLNDKRDVAFALRGVVVPRVKEEVKKPIHYFSQDMQLGDRNEEVKALQDCLIYLGFLKKGLNTGFFGLITKQAVIQLQNSRPNEILKPAKLTSGTGLVKSLTRNYLNSIFQK